MEKAIHEDEDIASKSEYIYNGAPAHPGGGHRRGCAQAERVRDLEAPGQGLRVRPDSQACGCNGGKKPDGGPPGRAAPLFCESCKICAETGKNSSFFCRNMVCWKYLSRWELCPGRRWQGCGPCPEVLPAEGGTRMKKTIVSLFCVLALCLGLLPTAALAAGESDLYVSGQLITESGCYENQDGTWTKVDGAEPASGQFYYDTSTATLTLNNVSIVGGAFDGTTLGAGICAKTKNEQALSVTINLIGTNTVSGSYGIYVSGDGDSDLIITGSGRFCLQKEQEMGYGVGIQVSSSIGYANLTINGVDVSTAMEVDRGIYFRSGTNNSNAALTVNGGKLTVSADYGITYQIGSNAGRRHS